MEADPTVVVVHDYVTQRGGAERVVLDLLRAFPRSRLVTSCWNRETSYPEFGDYPVETLWLDRFAILRRDPRRALPLLADAFRRHMITDADVVICSSSGWAHRVGTNAPKIVYCHNPARWLYQTDDYLPRLPPWTRSAFRLLTAPLRRSDRTAARSAAAYLVNSSVVAQRVRQTYDIGAHVVPPARGVAPGGPEQQVSGLEPGFLLTVSRPRGYKRTEAICDAVAAVPDERLVVVGGGVPAGLPSRIAAVTGVDDAQLRWLYAQASALIAIGKEDFGLTPVEAQAFGTPALLLRDGGYLDTQVDGVTGLFVDDASVPTIARGLRELRDRSWDPAAIRRAGERFSAEAFRSRVRDIVNDVQTSTRL